MSNSIDPHQIIDLTRQIYPRITDPAEILIEASKVAGIINILTKEKWIWDSEKGEAVLESILSNTEKKLRVEMERREEQMAAELAENRIPNRPRKQSRKRKLKAEPPVNIPPPAILGEQIKAYMRRGNRISKLARQLGVSTSTVYGWGAGKWQPTEPYRTKLEELLK